MDEYKCAFSSTLVSNLFGCDKAEQVTRRGGPDIACTSDAAHQRCEQLFQRMKAAALPAFGVEDDLLSMPHSVLVKIQHGGLLGLQRLLEPGAAGSAAVQNVHALVDQTVGKYGNPDVIPCPALVQDMTSYKLRRRG
jgi:hypothetical protein